MNADRNLLFGILALQLDFIDRDTLIEGMNAWVLEKSQPLGDLLVQRGKLSADRRQLLEALVGEHLATHDNDVELSLATVQAIGPLRSALEAFQDADMDASLAHVPDGSSDAVVAATISLVGASTGTGNRFQILRRHAKGGLGEVSIAVDKELHREVALKEIQEKYADQPEIRGRFVREAEITGGLEHPGIVPVYGLGHYDDGRPYYAMRFVKGDSLKRAIERFHEGSASSAPDRDLQLRKLLRRLVDVCNAMHYAHNRGVLHRDLKPGNIMVGKYGETLVVDWGLATCQSTDDLETTEVPLPPSASGSGVTLAGSVIGTPAYMSSEQADGRLDELGPRSDVYSLGATLYSLLTGKPPFSGKLTDVLAAVREGNFPPPRQVDRRVPAPLNAICLKAMAKQSADRYASCAELAEEIDAWLADAPVQAHRNLFYRGRLWVKRHRTVTVACSLIAVGLLLSLGYVARRSARLNDDIERHLRQAELLVTSDDLDRSEAELAFSMALCGDFAASPRWGLQIERRQQQLERFKTFLQHSRTARFHTPNSKRTASDVASPPRGQDELGALCREALNVYRVIEDPQWETWLDPEFFSAEQAQRVRQEVGELLVFLALRQALDFDDTPAAHARTKAALANLERAEKYIPVGPGIFMLRMLWQRKLGDDSRADAAGQKMSQLARDQGRAGVHLIDQYILAQCTQVVLKRPDDAIGIYQQLLSRRPDHFRTQLALSNCYYEIGDLDGQRRHLEACLALSPNDPMISYFRGMNSFEQGDYNLAFVDFESAIAKDADFAIGYFYRGRVRVVSEDWSEAVADFSLAIDRDPAFDAAYHWRAIGHAKIGKHAEAARDAERAIELDPQHPLTHYYAARALALAVAIVRTDEPAAGRAEKLAEEYGRRSLEILQRGLELGFDDFTRLAPDSDFDPVRSFPQFREVLRPAILLAVDAGQEKLQEEASPDPKQQLALGELHLSLGELESDAAEPDSKALDHFDQGAKFFQALLRDARHRRDAASLLLRTLERKAKLLDRLGRISEADPVWQQLALMQSATEATTIDRVTALARSGNHVEATKRIELLLEQQQDLSRNNLYNLACAFSIIIGVVQADDEIMDELREQRSSQLRGRVIEMLQQAAAKGFFETAGNLKHMQADTDFDPVRQSEEFQTFTEKLVTDLLSADQSPP